MKLRNGKRIYHVKTALTFKEGKIVEKVATDTGGSLSSAIHEMILRDRKFNSYNKEKVAA